MNNGGKSHIILSLLAVMAAISAAEAGTGGTNPVPKVVVNILIDQLRSDYIEAFMPLYGDNGFKRLLREGHVYEHASYPHSNPDRASASATIATGSSPYNHGIVGMRWLDRATLRPVFCVDDNDFAGLSTAKPSSPKYLGVSTIGDELKVATEGKALVYSISPFRDAAILSAGHAADGAVWIDNQTGNWASTTYYGQTLPSWANVRNQYNPISGLLRKETWRPSSELVGNFSYFLSGGMKKPFAHKFKGDDRYASFKASGLVNEETSALARTCIESTTIGSDAIPDYLSVTFYAGNYQHLASGDAPMELQDTYVRLDKAMGELIDAVDKKVGLSNAILVVTSTGYADEENADLSKYRIPTGTFDMKRTAALLNMYLMAVYGQGQYVESTLGTQLYLNHKLIENKQINFSELLARTQDFLMQLSGVKDVYTSHRLQLGAWTPGISRIRNGYNAKYSGDVLIEVSPGWRYVNADNSENQLVRESYVPFPIIFYGYGIPAKHETIPVTTDYIAPTLSKAMRIRAPNACSVSPIDGF